MNFHRAALMVVATAALAMAAGCKSEKAPADAPTPDTAVAQPVAANPAPTTTADPAAAPTTDPSANPTDPPSEPDNPNPPSPTRRAHHRGRHHGHGRRNRMPSNPNPVDPQYGPSIPPQN